jgi:hypothetical protein
MEIRVYLNNGDILDFNQSDPALAQATLAELQGGRAFSGRSLILGSAAACTVLQPRAISRIDLVTSAPVTLPTTFNEGALVIEDEAVFQTRAKTATAAFKKGIAPGEQYTGHLAFGLAGGHQLLLELQFRLANQTQFFTNLNRLLEAPVMTFAHPRGGAVWLNVANVAALNATPGFSDYPKGTILAELL